MSNEFCINEQVWIFPKAHTPILGRVMEDRGDSLHVMTDDWGWGRCCELLVHKSEVERFEPRCPLVVHEILPLPVHHRDFWFDQKAIAEAQKIKRPGGEGSLGEWKEPAFTYQGMPDAAWNHPSFEWRIEPAHPELSNCRCELDDPQPHIVEVPREER